MKSISRSRLFMLAGAVAVAAFFFIGRAPATNAAAAFDGEPEIVAATFSSAWCSACKILKPRLAKVIPDFAGEPVKFVEFDFTFGERDDIEALARTEGLGDLYPRYKGATGFTLLVDAKTGDIIDTLTINYSSGAMRSAIKNALKRVSSED